MYLLIFSYYIPPILPYIFRTSHPVSLSIRSPAYIDHIVLVKLKTQKNPLS